MTFQYPARDSEKIPVRSYFYGRNMAEKKKKTKKKNRKEGEKGAKEGENGAKVNESAEATTKMSKSSEEVNGGPFDVHQGEEQASEGPSSGKEKTSAGIRGLSFKVPPGSTVALVGSSGSGKSTVMRLLLRLYEADSGKILLDGLDVRTISLESLRRNIGTVSQDTVLFNSSLRRNVLYGVPGATDAEVWNSVRAAALGDFVSGLDAGLETKVGARGIKISGGERQRVGVARALIKRPCILLLDEATSALDSETERKVQESIHALCAGRTSLVIAHRLSTIMHADEICVMSKGEIKERGRHDDLLQISDGIYRNMWLIQTEGVRKSDLKEVG